MADFEVNVRDKSEKELRWDEEKAGVDLERARIALLQDQISLRNALVEEQDKRSEWEFKKVQFGFDDFNCGRIYIADPINDLTTNMVRRRLYGEMSKQNENGTKNGILLDFNSPGGSIFDGLNMFGVIREAANAGFCITTRISGLAASMAGVLVQAGDHRQMRQGSYLHIHEASGWTAGKTFEIRDTATLMKRLTEQIAKIYAERSTLTAEAIFERMDRKEWYLDAQEALDFKFIDEII